MFEGREQLSEDLLRMLTARDYSSSMDEVIDNFGADGLEFVISVVTVLEAGTSAIKGNTASINDVPIMTLVSGTHYSLAGAWRVGTKATNVFANAKADLVLEFELGDFTFPGSGPYRNLSKWRDSKDLKLTVKTKKGEVLTPEQIAGEAGLQNGFSIR